MNSLPFEENRLPNGGSSPRWYRSAYSLMMWLSLENPYYVGFLLLWVNSKKPSTDFCHLKEQITWMRKKESKFILAGRNASILWIQHFVLYPSSSQVQSWPMDTHMFLAYFTHFKAQRRDLLLPGAVCFFKRMFLLWHFPQIWAFTCETLRHQVFAVCVNALPVCTPKPVQFVRVLIFKPSVAEAVSDTVGILVWREL